VRDFTLLIPTYNRPQQLQALLFHVKSTSPGLKVLVLDSSDNQPAVHHCASDAELLRYPSNTHPFAKFADGVRFCTTEYCALCADDDVMLMDGVAACVDTLRANPLAAAARGQSFAYSWQASEPDGLYMTEGLLTPPVINALTPMERIAEMFSAYHAVIYAVHRTAVLRDALTLAVDNLTSLLGLELMVAALEASWGAVLTVPAVYHGRSMGTSVVPYREWHPLEYFVNNADGMAAEYQTYRGLLSAAVVSRPDNRLHDNQVKRAIDVIHLRYLLRHAPNAVLDFLIGRKTIGVKPEGYLSQEMQDVLLTASMLAGRNMSKEERDAIAGRMDKYMHALLAAPQQAKAS
jgi:glycosyltransferase domain-containing protein